MTPAPNGALRRQDLHLQVQQLVSLCSLLQVLVQIDEEVDGDTATTTNFAMVVTLMARLGAVRGLRCVPLVMADAVTVTQALVLEKALITLRTDALIDSAHVDDSQTGRASPLGAALQRWLDAVLRPSGAPSAATR